jgi:hypothetical protein
MKRLTLLALLVLTLWGGTAAYETVMARKSSVASHFARDP